MIYVKGKIKDYASNQSELDETNDLSKSALDRSSRSILDEYQQKFENNQAILQGYIDVLKNLSEKVSSIGDSVQKQYEWLRNQDFIPATEGGQEALDDIGEKLCQTMGDDGNGNPGCNVTIEQIDDFTDCIATGDSSGCSNTCDSHIQMCVDIGESSCPTACESVCQDICESQCQDQCQGTTEGTCDTPVETCPVEWLDTCEATKDDNLYTCNHPSQEDENCTSYGQDNWCGLLESECYQVVDVMSCVTLGDYSGTECYDVGETNCAYSGEKYCTASGEKYCNQTGEMACLFTGEQHCIFEGEDDWFCTTIADEYMCNSSGDGPNACYTVGEDNCAEVGEKYCRQPGEKFYCFFIEDKICTALADTLENCQEIEDTWVMCEKVVVDSCGIPFKDCFNSGLCPPEYGQAAGCDVEGCEPICNSSCISTCDSSCFKGCDKSCTSYCDTGCERQCNGNCNDICIDTCDTSCFNGCNKSCLSTCISTCDVNCFGTCIDTCDSSCFGTCIDTCDTTCFHTCITTCDATCFGTCITYCDSSCFSGCNKSCTSYCDTGCERTCDSNCYNGCNKSCTSYCDAGCDSSCFKGCNDECTGYSCNKTCDINFQCTGCDGTAPCMAACIPSQETCTECGEEGGQCQAGRWCTAPVK